jgi:hypothetical protein
VVVPTVAGAVVLALAARSAAVPGALPVPGGLGPRATFRPSIASALIWSMAFGLACALLGAAAALSDDREGGRREQFLGAALRGGWRMTWSILGLSFVGLLVVAALHPGAVRGAVDRAFSGGAGPGTTAVTAAALVTPNAAALAAAASMGGRVNVEVLGSSCTALSYARVPADLPPGAAALGLCRGRFSQAPLGSWLFLLVPAVATVAGGHRAARAADAAAPGEGVTAGIVAGLGFGVMFLGLLALAGIGVEANGPAGRLFGGSEVSFRITALPTWWVGALWGLGGGALGGAIGARRAEGPGEPEPSDYFPRS